MNRRSLILLAAVLAAAAVLLAVSGGVRVTVGGFRISARSPLPAAVVALGFVAAWWIAASRAWSVRADLEAVWAVVEQRAGALVPFIAVASGLAAMVFATGSASGADASGYLSQAAMWASGSLFHVDELAKSIGASDPWITTPLGWRPTPMPGLQAPTYPPGLPLLMSIVAGSIGVGSVLIVSAVAAVWATGALASRLAGGVAGALAALVIAVSPVFLFQSIQPMSDVPVTAAWTLTWLLLVPGSGVRDPGSARSLLAGLACALAVLIRPNLAPLAAIPLFAIGWNVRRLIAFSIPVALAGIALMWLQWTWYGSPFRSGYGAADELFALSNIGSNASRYLEWMTSTSPVLVLAPAGILVLWRRDAARPIAAFGLLVVAAYLVYAVFDVWSYLRFLLPAMALAAVFAGAAVSAVVSRAPVTIRSAALLTIALAIAAHGVTRARSLDTFRLADQHRRVAQAAAYLSAVLPANGVIVAGEQSGALRYYTGRSILRWEAATAETLARAIETLSANGRPVVFALDAWEQEPFRTRFGALAVASLEWPPAFEAGASPRTRVWRLVDRDAFQRGDPVRTERQP